MISVIIPSYNSEDTIAKCIDALQGQSHRGNYEIILVDSSIDRTPEIVSGGYSNVNLIHLGDKTDPGTARNMGLEQAKGGLIAFIDSDCVAAHDWLEKIVSAHQSSYNIVGGVVKNGNDESDLVAWAGYISEFREFLPKQPKKEVTHIPTCNISYKRKIFQDFGFFQGEYYPQEDLVFNYNLCRKGEKILLDPAIQVAHHHRSNLKAFFSHQYRIGEITSRVLKVLQLEGAFIARHPLSAIFFIPILPVIKFFRTTFAFLKYQPLIIIKRPFALILFAMGLVFWIRGFASGIYEKSQS